MKKDGKVYLVPASDDNLRQMGIENTHDNVLMVDFQVFTRYGWQKYDVGCWIRVNVEELEEVIQDIKSMIVDGELGK